MHRIPRTTVAILLIAALAVLSAFSGGPPPQTTGAPRIGTFIPERTCSQISCHIGSPVNSEGKLEILGLPETYVPGTNYPLTVRLTSAQPTGQPRWGFELTNARLSDGRGSGRLIASDLIVTPTNNRLYVSQNFANLHLGEHGSVEWQISWTAPDTAEGPVGFYAAGNASNGNFVAGFGDLIYTVGETTQAGLVPVERMTWGRLKNRFTRLAAAKR